MGSREGWTSENALQVTQRTTATLPLGAPWLPTVVCWGSAQRSGICTQTLTISSHSLLTASETHNQTRQNLVLAQKDASYSHCSTLLPQNHTPRFYPQDFKVSSSAGDENTEAPKSFLFS